MKRIRPWCFFAALFFSAFSVAFATDWTCQYCGQTFHFDPRDTAYMENWKQMHIAQVHSGGGATSSGPAAFGGANPFDALFQPLGQALANALLGNPQQQAIDEARAQQRRQQQRDAERLDQERLEREQQLAEEARRREFADAKERMLGQMKGLGGGGFDGGATDLPVLRVKEVDDIFGTKAMKPAGPDEPGVEVGGFKMKKIDFTPHVPPVGAEVETPESKAERERMRQQILAYQALVDRGKKQLDDFHGAEAKVKNAEAQLAAARQAEADARQKKAMLEATPPAPDAAPPAGLDDALAALAKAEQASADADRALAEAKRQQGGVEQQMRETLQSLAQTPRPPGWSEPSPGTPPSPPDR